MGYIVSLCILNSSSTYLPQALSGNRSSNFQVLLFPKPKILYYCDCSDLIDISDKNKKEHFSKFQIYIEIHC